MQAEVITEILSKTEIARGLEQADLERVLAHSQVETVDADEVVIAEGQEGEAGYVVLAGALKVVLLSGGHPNRAADIHLATLKAGDCFGEYSLIDAESASATVITTEPTKLLKISRTRFKRIDAAQDRIAKIIYRNLLRLLVRRLRKKNRELDFDWDTGG